MSVVQRLRERFWFIPALLCVTALIAAEGLITVDERLGPLPLPGWADSVLYRVGESGSRDILGAIAASSLGVAGTTFSITMAVLALTSSTYGPRLVRNFMADRGNQVVLGVYVSTFLYSLLVLRSIRAVGDLGDPEAEVFVPHLAVNGAVLLATANVAVLIYFIHHISDSIQVSTLASGIRADLFAVVDRLYPAEVGHGADQDRASRELPAALGSDGVPIAAERPGYVQFVADDDLMDTARRHDLLIALRVRPGEYVRAGTVVAVVHPAARVAEKIPDEVRATVNVADARSPVQDVEFAVQQLTEMAVRALSPGTNDPYTAVNALQDLSAGLSRLAARPSPSPARLDQDGILRIHAPRPEVGSLVSDVVNHMRWYAKDHPEVMHEALQLLARIGDAAHSSDLRTELAVHATLLTDAFHAARHHSHDNDAFDRHARSVLAGLRAPRTGTT